MGVEYEHSRGVRARPTCQKHVNDPLKGRFWCHRQEQKRLGGDNSSIVVVSARKRKRLYVPLSLESDL